MRRDKLGVEIGNVEWRTGDDAPRRPTLTVTGSAAGTDLAERLQTAGDGSSNRATVDVTYRFTAADRDRADGVLAFTDRLTGEFLLEVNVPPEPMMEFVSAARRFAERADDDVSFRARVRLDEETHLEVDKRTLLVYSSEGELLRERSLIPSGVEI